MSRSVFKIEFKLALDALDSFVQEIREWSASHDDVSICNLSDQSLDEEVAKGNKFKLQGVAHQEGLKAKIKQARGLVASI